MAALPSKMYYVLIKPGGKPLRYGQKGGGKYSDEKSARSQYKYLKAHGSNVELYTGNIEWEIVESSKENPMEGMPGIW
jgi:hypothetical protein